MTSTSPARPGWMKASPSDQHARSAPAVTLIVLALSARHRLPRGRVAWRHLVVAAFFCNALPFALFGIGEQTVDSGVAGVLNATTPLWSVLIGIAIGTERALNLVRVGGLLVGFAGTLLIFAPWRQGGLASWGSLAILAAAASYAIAFAYMGRFLVGQGTAPIALSAAQLVAATGLSALAMPWTAWSGRTPTRPRCSPWRSSACSPPGSPSPCTTGSSRTRARPAPRRSGTCCRSSRWCSARSCSASRSPSGWSRACWWCWSGSG